MNPDTAISVSHVSKRYSIGVQKDGSLRGTLVGLIGSKAANPQEEFWALNDVSFEIKKGEVIGIIGKNGAGKSTLLKILSQITKPTTGRIEINGRVASLLEVGTGFHPELTGRENIYLNGTILGMTRQEVKDKFDEIVEFSGVQKFIDTPVKHYSSGMYVRLAFAVAAHLEPEILIIDEVLAVGDADFQKKCLGKMKEVAGKGRTVLFVSHQLSSMMNLCDTGILLEHGELIFKGTIEEAVNRYVSRNIFSSTIDLSDFSERSGNGLVVFKSVSINSESDTATIKMGSTIKLSIQIEAKEELMNCSVNVRLNNSSQVKIAAWRSNEHNFNIDLKPGYNNIQLEILDLNIFDGIYNFSLAVFKGKEMFDLIEEAFFFEVLPNQIPLFGDKIVGKNNNLIYTPCIWQITPSETH